MKIAVIGPGSMGLLYGAKLSKVAEVTLIGNNSDHIQEIQRNGVVIKRDGQQNRYSVLAKRNGEVQEPSDLVILFVKSYRTKEALDQNKKLIGRNTVLMTLQNGAGHEEILREYADEGHILIGTTAQGSYRENAYTIVNSGLGDTVIGQVENKALETDISLIRDLLIHAGFPCVISDNIRQTVWNKLMINASSSVLSGVLQTAQGFIAEDEYAWMICRKLIHEICEVANRDGCRFDPAEQTERIRKHLRYAPGGYTSIYTDLKNGRKTEVEYISGAVVSAAERTGISVPTQSMMVSLVHAMENRGVVI